MTTVKELKVIAKQQGIVGYSKMNKQQLIDIIEQQAANEVSRNNSIPTTACICENAACNNIVPTPYYGLCDDCTAQATTQQSEDLTMTTTATCTKCNAPVESAEYALCEDCEDAQLGANEVSAPQQQQAPVQQQRRNYNNMDTTARPMQQYAGRKVIQFVKADNSQVCFYAKGKKVRIYIDDNMNLILHSERRGRTTVTYAQLIDMMNRFNNNTHGDIARVVKAIVRLNKNLIQAKLDLHQARRNCR